jgi:hypothetical protein
MNVFRASRIHIPSHFIAEFKICLKMKSVKCSVVVHTGSLQTYPKFSRLFMCFTSFVFSLIFCSFARSFLLSFWHHKLFSVIVCRFVFMYDFCSLSLSRSFHSPLHAYLFASFQRKSFTLFIFSLTQTRAREKSKFTAKHGKSIDMYMTCAKSWMLSFSLTNHWTKHWSFVGFSFWTRGRFLDFKDVKKWKVL